MKSRLSMLALIVALLLAAAVPSAAAPLTAPCAPGASYDPACDVDHDGDVDIFDIQLTAGHWNRSGAWTGGGEDWSLTGNTGTNAASNFLGTSDDQPLVVRVNGHRALLVRPASDPAEAPSIIAGHGSNSILAGVWGATIGGGGAEVGSNFVTDHYGTVGGGRGNRAGDSDLVIDDATLATVGGGNSNTASGEVSTVSGGASNIASGGVSFVGGGVANRATGDYSTVPGGGVNEAAGDYSFAAGRSAKALADGSFVWADSQERDFTSNTPNQFLVRASAGGYVEANNLGYALLAFNDNALGQGVRGATDGTYAGYFEDDIFVAGQCTGCLLAYVALNADAGTLAVGDLVAPAGLAEPLQGSGAAVLRVQRAEAGQGVVGVVTARAELHSAVRSPDGVTEQVAERAEGAIQPGDYLFIAVQGLAPVRIAAGEAVAPGQRLTVAGAGQARALRTVAVEGVIVDESAPTVGIVVDLPDPATGLAQVMISLR